MVRKVVHRVVRRLIRKVITTWTSSRTAPHAIEALRHARVKPETIPRLPPEAVNILRTFYGYARRAASELARYGLEAAD